MPISLLQKLGHINSAMQDPLARCHAVTTLPGTATVEPMKQRAD